MPELLSQSYSYYDCLQNVSIADMTYKNVRSVDSKRFIDGDNVEKTINDIDARDGRYVCIANDKKVEYSSKQYYYPVSRKLGNKVYNNIYINRIGRDGVKVYEMYNNGIFNEVKVMPSGEVFDTNAIKRQKLKKALMKPFRNIAEKLMKARKYIGR